MHILVALGFIFPGLVFVEVSDLCYLTAWLISSLYGQLIPNISKQELRNATPPMPPNLFLPHLSKDQISTPSLIPVTWSSQCIQNLLCQIYTHLSAWGHHHCFPSKLLTILPTNPSPPFTMLTAKRFFTTLYQHFTTLLFYTLPMIGKCKCSI